MKRDYIITFENDEEIQAVKKLIEEMRAEEKRKERHQYHKHCISSCIAHSIGELGLEETKRIVRELNRELRELK